MATTDQLRKAQRKAERLPHTGSPSPDDETLRIVRESMERWEKRSKPKDEGLS
jgi:hypothetical protein